MGKRIDLTGQRFGRLTVIKETNRRANGSVLWECKCDCGNTVLVRSNHLRRGGVLSCGCYNRDIITKHGGKHNPLYHTLQCMRDRCYNTNAKEYKDYGERGIKVCDEWLNSYEAFRDWAMANGYRKGLTIDRINNDGDYEPSNCRWTDMKIQCRNRRSNVYIECDGERHCLSEWAELLREPYAKLASRHRRGWSDREILYGRM